MPTSSGLRGLRLEMLAEELEQEGLRPAPVVATEAVACAREYHEARVRPRILERLVEASGLRDQRRVQGHEQGIEGT